MEDAGLGGGWREEETKRGERCKERKRNEVISLEDKEKEGKRDKER